MAQILKPANLNVRWAMSGDTLDPGNSKYAQGWAVEIPPRQYFNWIDNRQDEALAHINQHGIAVWDAETEYQADKSYTQGATNGTIYRCVQTHINQDPETDLSNTYWIIAFASAGDFYTKTESDGLYLAKANNLSDLTNTATARANLSVYSQAQTYTKTEVDAKTTVASTAQAQGWASNTTLITPLRLSEAFKGSNQSLVGSGFQKLPGGLIIQWGTAPTTGGDIVITLPVTFPNAILQAFTTNAYTVGSGAVGYWGTDITSASQITVRNNTTGLGGRWFAIGW